MQTPFLLSHHSPRDYHRCLRLGGVHLCARCLGVYPAMFLAIGVQIALRTPLELPQDLWIAFLLPLPALVDWARGKLDPSTGSNLTRLSSGVLLGLSLGRTIYLHLRRPGFWLTMVQLGALGVVFLSVEALARLRRGRADRNDGPGV